MGLEHSLLCYFSPLRAIWEVCGWQGWGMRVKREVRDWQWCGPWSLKLTGQHGCFLKWTYDMEVINMTNAFPKIQHVTLSELIWNEHCRYNDRGHCHFLELTCNTRDPRSRAPITLSVWLAYHRLLSWLYLALGPGVCFLPLKTSSGPVSCLCHCTMQSAQGSPARRHLPQN